MENTIKNMELTMSHLSSTLESSDYRANKTLINTYFNLLSGINIAKMGRESIISYSKTLKKQAIEAEYLQSRLEEEFEVCMNMGKYKDTHIITFVLEQLNKIKTKLVGLGNIKTQEEADAARIATLPQNRTKILNNESKREHIAIFGKERSSTKEKYMELYNQFEKDILIKYNSHQELSFETKDVKVIAVRYSDFQRGRRLDEIYIDTNLSIDALNTIKMMKRDKDTPVHYF